jgi:hypothetical protein
MAILFPADNDIRVVTPASPRGFSVDELHGLVGGYFEIIRVDGPICADILASLQHRPRVDAPMPVYLIINEDGKRLALPPNYAATFLYWASGGMPDDRIVGDAVLADHMEVGEDDDDTDPAA